MPVLIALMHDLLITAGVYALTGREVTASTVAALLTILGYSLYDTIIVFDRVRENVQKMQNAAFSQIVNRSMSEVLTRSLATSLCTLLPILALLLFGGSTLKDFAFALLVGVASGAYSSIFIASPVLTHWKEREPVYRRRRARIAAENGGVVPAYATEGVAAREIEVVDPRRSRRTRLTTPTRADGTVSPGEFRELDPRPGAREAPAPSVPRAAGGPDRGRAARGRRDARDAPSAARRRRREARAAGARGGLADGNARLGHHGARPLALHDLPARPLLGRDRRRVPRLDRRGDHQRPRDQRRGARGVAIPGRHGTHVATVLYAVPGALLAMALIYLLGAARERAHEQRI